MCLEIDGEDVDFWLWFETQQRMTMSDGKWESIPDDRASIRKSALPLKFLASDRNAENAWISRWAERPGGSEQLKKICKIRRRRTWDNSVADNSNLVFNSVRNVRFCLLFWSSCGLSASSFSASYSSSKSLSPLLLVEIPPSGKLRFYAQLVCVCVCVCVCVSHTWRRQLRSIA